MKLASEQVRSVEFTELVIDVQVDKLVVVMNAGFGGVQSSKLDD